MVLFSDLSITDLHPFIVKTACFSKTTYDEIYLSF